MGKATKAGFWAKMLVLGILFTLILSGCSQQNSLTENADQGDIALYFFWGDGCPHCAQAKPVLEELDRKYSDLAIRSYEVYYNADNQALYMKMADAFQVPEEGRGVPIMYLNNRYWIGWTPSIGEQIEAAIKTCQAEGCADAGAGIIPGARTDKPEVSASNAPIDPQAKEINLFGMTINLESQSLLVSTLLISFVDGFNPCSLWVLSMLLALTLHTGSRRKVFLIGIIFLTVTAAVYAMFIAGLFTFLTIVSFATWIQVLVALVALFFALVNIKDYFWYKEGLSLTISDKNKPGIYQRIRRVLDASQSFWGMAGATVVLAGGVSLVEFSCTAGFPVLWTNLLSSQNVTAGAFVLLLLVYMLVYQLDELVIFFTAVSTLKASRLEEKQGRILKLISGTLMFTLAVVMIVNPAFMNSLTGSLIVFGIAFGLVLMVLLLHRRVLPAYGIWIGTEAEGHKRAKKRVARKVTRH